MSRCRLRLWRVLAIAFGLFVNPPATTAQASQTAGLRIVVVEGEAAVNIIQQKTAVAPVVEVRDRNDQPVAGALVKFTVAKGRATFNGAKVLTVTTDAAGRAAAAGLTPSGVGPVQITAAASFQRQSAVATITQTNVTTLASQAAAGGVAAGGAAVGTAAAGVAAAGGAAATGGGLGAAAITAIAAGAGGGALIAAKAAGVIGGKTPCQFTVSPTSVTVASSLLAAPPGPNPSVNISLSDPDCGGQDWTATSNAPFIAFGDGNATVSTLSGSGARQLFLNIEANTPGRPARSGTFTVAGQTVTVTQNGRCLYQVSPTTITFPHSGGTQVITVTVTPPVCDTDTWTASTISSFISLNPTSGKGSGVVNATAAPNPFSSGPGLTGNISVANFIIPFIQP